MSLCRILDHLLADQSRQVVIVPHSQENRSFAADDRRYTTRFLRHFDYHPRLLAINGDHSMREFKGVINRAQLAICERGHAAMGGLSCGVCTITVGFSRKGIGIATDVLGRDPGDVGLFLSCEDLIEKESIFSMIDHAWEHRDELSEMIKRRLPEIERRAALNYDLLSQVVSSL